MNTPGAEFAEREFLRGARHSLAEGRAGDALDNLRGALRRRALSSHGVERAGALVRESLAVTGTARGRILLLGQCTTSWLRNVLAAVALSEDFDFLVDDGGYDTVLQDVSALPHYEGGDAPHLVLLPWSDRLLTRSSSTPSERAEHEVRYWSEVWRAAQARGIAHVIQVGFDWIGPGAIGYYLSGRDGEGGDVDVVRRTNIALRRALPSGSYYIPLEEVSGVKGRLAFYDQRGMYWTRQPFSERGLVVLAAQVVAGLRAVTTGPRKVLVLDLDNTLWGGIVGEVGALDIALGVGTPDGEAFLDFQRYVKALSDRGILLAVCSKNEPSDAREPFLVHPDIALSLDDFAAFEASWAPKVESIRRIAEVLRLGLESFVFFDDNPAEREHVRQAMPEVMVIEVPEDPAGFIRALEESLAFEAVALTTEDLRRRESYAVEGRRREAADKTGSIEGYLRSLEMVGSLRPIGGADLPRVVQLLGRTNQFNLTTRRHGPQQVQAMLAQPDSVGFTLRLRDRFGDHGLVGVVIAVPSEGDGSRVLRVDTLLMSCRVIGRTAEQLLVNHLAEEARRRGFHLLHGDFRPTAKNALVRQFWETVGFARISPSDAGEGVETFELRLADAALLESFVLVDEGT